MIEYIVPTYAHNVYFFACVVAPRRQSVADILKKQIMEVGIVAPRRGEEEEQPVGGPIVTAEMINNVKLELRRHEQAARMLRAMARRLATRRQRQLEMMDRTGYDRFN